jgi:hypothetical protein
MAKGSKPKPASKPSQAPKPMFGKGGKKGC